MIATSRQDNAKSCKLCLQSNKRFLTIGFAKLQLSCNLIHRKNLRADSIDSLLQYRDYLIMRGFGGLVLTRTCFSFASFFWEGKKLPTG